MGGLRTLRSVPALVHLLLLRPVLKLLLGVHVEGRENLSGLEQFILVANHNSHLDVLLLFHALPARHLRGTHPVAAYEYFSGFESCCGWWVIFFSRCGSFGETVRRTPWPACGKSCPRGTAS